MHGISLDAWSERTRLEAIRAIKIDVEGAELGVLRGAMSTLSVYHPKLIVEFSESMQAAFGHSCSELANFLRSFDYRLRRITTAGLVPYVSHSEDQGIFNVFAD